MQLKKTLMIALVAGVVLLGVWLLGQNHAPVIDKSMRTGDFGDITIAQPLWGSRHLDLIFVDTGKYPPTDLGRRVAATGATAVIIDTRQFFKNFSAQTGQCLDPERAATAISGLLKALPAPPANGLVIAGLEDGALLPFLNAEATPAPAASNLSIGFSVNLPANLLLCPPFVARDPNQADKLTAPSGLKSNWRSVWTDHPSPETAIFVKTLGVTNTRIAAYDTPLDTVLLEELSERHDRTDQTAPPLPIVEVPAAKPSANLTLFYSGDGGWRDLDRTVAEQMAAQNYPVAGVDTLRYFWDYKTPEQAAASLTAAMAHYRRHWGVKTFVLAGYSFGADVLPALYNRLSPQDRDSVELLVLLALAQQADFEIHVAGWLGQNAGGQPVAPELAQIPKAKILCVYGQEERAETGCTSLQNSAADILELPGGHHFDQDYPKLTRQILAVFRRHGIN